MRRQPIDVSRSDRIPRSIAATRSRRLAIVACVGLGVITVGCRRYREDLDYEFRVEQTWPLEGSPDLEFVQFESVFWEPDDTLSLRARIVDDSIASGRSVLEIGTGTGLIAILCQRHDAKRVVATDINPAAVANARYNAAMLDAEQGLEIRQVALDEPEAFSPIAAGERFDLILSKPPWEDGDVTRPAEYAFYDPDFALLDSLLEGLPRHLNPGGRCLLAYGHVPAIDRLLSRAGELGYEAEILDDRQLDSLPENFLPGMLIEIRPASP